MLFFAFISSFRGWNIWTSYIHDCIFIIPWRLISATAGTTEARVPRTELPTRRMMIFVALISSFHVSPKWTIYFPQFRSQGLSKKNDHCWELGPGELRRCCSLPFFGNLRFVEINKLIFGDIEYRYIFFITQLLKDTYSFFF